MHAQAHDIMNIFCDEKCIPTFFIQGLDRLAMHFFL